MKFELLLHFSVRSPQTTQLQLKLTTPKRSPESGNFQHLKKKINNWVHTAETSQKSENTQADGYFGLQNVYLGGDPKPCLPVLHLPIDQRPVHTVIPSSHRPALPSHTNPSSTECL